jgi:hypothetical protein
MWFFKYAYPPVTQKTIVIIDPDMMFLRPFLNGALPETLTASVTAKRLQEIGLADGKPTDRVKKGRPVGQMYGIGSQFLHYKAPYDLPFFCKRTEEEFAGVPESSEKHESMVRLAAQCNKLTDEVWSFML